MSLKMSRTSCKCHGRVDGRVVTAALTPAVLSASGEQIDFNANRTIVAIFQPVFVLLRAGRAPPRKPPAGFEGSIGAVGEHQPQHAKLRPVPQVFL